MPSTVNGIGTHYYGQKNYESRPGTCPHCGRAVNLASYDTRLWFVVVFIPIIPLGRKRILDKCPSCSRHYVVDADKWEASKQLEISGAEEKFRTSPTPENAMAVHKQLVSFHQFNEAAEFRKRVTAQFPDSAQLQAFFGDSLVYFGRQQDAAPYYARALALRPDLPAARAGVAEEHIRAGRLDEAAKLLEFLTQPGAGQLYTLAPLERLGLAYQRANRHDEALAAFNVLLRELPQLSDNVTFRKMVQKSEKTLGRKETFLPKKKFSWSGLFTRKFHGPQATPQTTGRSLVLIGIILALIGAGFVVANEYIRRHRTIQLVNGYSQPAFVEISGRPGKEKVTRINRIVLPEGHYHATVSGPVNQEFDFDVTASYFDRWFEDPAWVLNVGGDAILISHVATYARNAPPGGLSVHVGQPFEHFLKLTHPFEALPPSVQLKDGESKVLVDLQFFDGTGADVVNYYLEEHDPDHALIAAEAWLHTHPQDEIVPWMYLATANRQKAVGRADAFLRAGLAERPIRMEWHRAFQDLHRAAVDNPALVARYDSLLAATPNDSALLYLRGRIEGRQAAMHDYFTRSVQADPRNAYPLYGLAYDFIASGDWSDARPLLARASGLKPNDRQFEYFYTLARLNVGEAAAVEKETRERLVKSPASAMLAFRLIDALAAQGRSEAELMKVANQYAVTNGKGGERDPSVVAAVHRHALYAAADFAALEKASGGASPEERTSRAQALIEQGRLAEAAKVLPGPEESDDELENALTLAAAWRSAGNAAEADRWLIRAKKALGDSRADFVKATSWFEPGGAPTLAAAQAIPLLPEVKAILLVGVVAWHPEAGKDLLPLARRLNTGHTFPYHFVQRATSTVR